MFVETGVAGDVVSGVVGSVVGSVVGAGFGAVFTAAGQWVASGAVWLLGQVGGAMSASTTVELSSGWFRAHEAVMEALAAAVMLPLVCCAAIQALYRQSGSMLARAVLVQLPLALLLTGVAVELVRLSLAVTDALSAQVLSGSGVDASNILAPVSDFLMASGVTGPGVPAFVVFIGGLFVALAALGLWLELVVRAAAVSVAVLFLPLALAALVWPAVAHWCRRLADTLAALILSKLVIAAVLGLATGALAGGLGVGGGGGAGGDGGGFASVVTGIALLVIATVSPFTLLRLVPAIESNAVAHLESSRHRLSSVAGAGRQSGNLAFDVMRDAERRRAGGAAGAAAGTVGMGAASVGAVAGAALSRHAEVFGPSSVVGPVGNGSGAASGDDRGRSPTAPVPHRPPDDDAGVDGR